MTRHVAIRTGATVRACLVLAPMLAAAAALEGACAQPGGDPRVPAGRDPGGIPVAILGPGIDYRAPEVAGRLARDGEGELIGWDFIDNDARPFEASPDCVTMACSDTAPPDVAPGAVVPSRLLLAEAGASRLIVLKLRDGDRGTLAAAIAFVSRGPARIVPTLVGGTAGAGPDWPLLIEAARRFSNLLFIVPAYGPPIDVAGFADVPVGNLLIVAPASPAGELSTRSMVAPVADVAVAVEGWLDRPPDGNRRQAERAAARVAAIAARLLAVDPLLDAHGLKSRILTLAAPLPLPDASRVRSGWLATPRRHFWPE